MSLRLARVVASHPEDVSVDLIMLDDFSRMVGVQVMCGSAATDAGHMMPIAPDTPSDSQWDLHQETSRDVKAVVGMLGRNPVVLGFLHQQITQMTFKDGRSITRFPGDVYVSADLSGNYELYHPSGSFFRIGTPGHEDLTGKDVDGLWKIARNTASNPTITLGLAVGGTTKATMTFDPTGKVTVQASGEVDVAAGGNVNVTATGNANITATGNAVVTASTITLNGPVTASGNLTVNGNFHAAHTV
jgi:hypothetical protein